MAKMAITVDILVEMPETVNPADLTYSDIRDILHEVREKDIVEFLPEWFNPEVSY
jgi:hypothetical protein